MKPTGRQHFACPDKSKEKYKYFHTQQYSALGLDHLLLLLKALMDFRENFTQMGNH